MSSRQVVKVEHKVSVAAFTSRDEKWVGEGREEDTTEERCEGERERRFRLKVTGKGVGGTRVAKCNVNLMKECVLKVIVLPFYQSYLMLSRFSKL